MDYDKVIWLCFEDSIGFVSVFEVEGGEEPLTAIEAITTIVEHLNNGEILKSIECA